MRHQVVPFVVALLACANALAADVSCKVVGVTDGDTLTCLTSDKQQIKVRLAQIDAPEKSQPYGKESKRALSDLVFGREVTLEPETTDRYGRTVAQVVIGGKDVNLQMVSGGMAWVYDKYAHDHEYFDAQNIRGPHGSGCGMTPMRCHRLSGGIGSTTQSGKPSMIGGTFRPLPPALE